jgi:hypothetical protein
MAIAPPEEVFAFLKKAHDEFQPLSVEIRFDKSQALHSHVMALYGSIIELTGSSIILVDRKLIAGVPILLRAILEAYVDLLNLVRDPKYGYQLHFGYVKEWLKLLDEAKTGKSEYLMAISKDAALDGTIAEWKAQKDKLEAAGYKGLTIEGKFKAAGMEKEYRSIYNSLCSDSHNNLRSLIGRHIEVDSSDFSVVFYKAYTLEDSAVYVGTGLELLMRATQLVHEFYKSSAQEKILEYRKQVDKLRGDG